MPLAERRNSANENQLYAWVADGSEHLFTFPNHVFPYNPLGGGGALYVEWFQSGGAAGKEPPGLREEYSLFHEGFGLPEERRIENGKQIWRIVTEDVFSIGTVGLSLAAIGIRVVNDRLGNVPSRQYNSPDGKTPGISCPATFYMKN